MAAWTKRHGKDDAKNPFSRQNTLAILTLVMALGLALSAHAQTKAPTRIHVVCTNDDGDTTGRDYCSAVRDAVARSPRYIETNVSSSHVAPGDTQFEISIATVGVLVGGRPVGSAASVVLIYSNHDMDLIYSQWAHAVPASQFEESATNTLADVDSEIHK